MQMPTRRPHKRADPHDQAVKMMRRAQQMYHNTTSSPAGHSHPVQSHPYFSSLTAHVVPFCSYHSSQDFPLHVRGQFVGDGLGGVGEGLGEGPQTSSKSSQQSSYFRQVDPRQEHGKFLSYTPQPITAHDPGVGDGEGVGGVGGVGGGVGVGPGAMLRLMVKVSMILPSLLEIWS